MLLWGGPFPIPSLARSLNIMHTTLGGRGATKTNNDSHSSGWRAKKIKKHTPPFPPSPPSPSPLTPFPSPPLPSPPLSSPLSSAVSGQSSLSISLSLCPFPLAANLSSPCKQCHYCCSLLSICKCSPSPPLPSPLPAVSKNHPVLASPALFPSPASPPLSPHSPPS